MELNQDQICQISQKPEQETYIDPEKYYNMPIDKLKYVPLRKLLSPDYIKNLDKNLKFFAKLIRENLQEENYEIFATTGFAGTGKSQLNTVIGCLIDPSFSFGKNINFIPTANEVERDYLDLPMYSFFQIDEASRSVHKHKWYEKTQQKLIQLYDTERENHYICSGLIMPRFNNFTENFRNFFIKYWINIIVRGVCIVYRRDEDKDTKDPWNIDDSVKLKKKYWGGKRIFERNVSDIIRMEQKTKNYWFYFTIPKMPDEVWSIYKLLKKQSRIKMREDSVSLEVESYKDKLERTKVQRWVNIVNLRNAGKNINDIAVELNMSAGSVRTNMRQIEAYQKYKGEVFGVRLNYLDIHNNIYSLKDNDNLNETSALNNKVQNVKPQTEEWDINGLTKKD